MLHPGIASEMSKLESQERLREASVRRPGPRAEQGWGPSAAGAAGLLAIALLGPVATILVVGAMVAIAAVVVGLGRGRGMVAVGPEAQDRWAAWRVVEPDAEYRRRRAA
ncbi:MAG TPA: hypothetical protein VFZ75_12380 [Actinomycetota bacterium]|nr:hypothetical protein [Actinomycetota bacterium]